MMDAILKAYGACIEAQHLRFGLQPDIAKHLGENAPLLTDGGCYVTKPGDILAAVRAFLEAVELDDDVVNAGGREAVKHAVMLAPKEYRGIFRAMAAELVKQLSPDQKEI